MYLPNSSIRKKEEAPSSGFCCEGLAPRRLVLPFSPAGKIRKQLHGLLWQVHSEPAVRTWGVDFTESVINAISLAGVKGIPWKPAPLAALHLQAFSVSHVMHLFMNKNSCFKDTVNILKFPSISKASVFSVGRFSTMRFNFPGRSVFSGFCV